MLGSASEEHVRQDILLENGSPGKKHTTGKVVKRRGHAL